MMAKEYALWTIQIFVSAVGVYFKMKGWQAPYTNERFQMTMQGIARDIGDRKLKKPPVEARHVAALMGMDRPSEWTLQQWLQGKACAVRLAVVQQQARLRSFPALRCEVQ